MKISWRAKFGVSFIIVVVITGLVTTWIGTHLIGIGIVREAQKRVEMDLNSAREVYQRKVDDIQTSVRLTAIRFFIKDALISGNIKELNEKLKSIREKERLDILTLTDDKGKVIVRTRNPQVVGDTEANDELVNKVLQARLGMEKKVVASTQIVPSEELMKEGEDLARQSYIKFIPTPKAKPQVHLGAEKKSLYRDRMMIKAVAPIMDGNKLLGVLYGGELLNRNYEIVDKVKEVVFKGEKYKGKDMGTATIFQGDLRISTNVEREDGTRAIGTQVSEEVYNQVLVKGISWIDRAFVVNNWYITAYEPIRNIKDEIIGILYVGILEDKFMDMKRRTLWTFLGITLAGMVIAFAISHLLGNSIVRPIRCLVSTSKKLAKGDLSQRVKYSAKDEIGELGMTFNYMADAIKERDERLKEQTKNQIMKSEKLAMIGRLAAGVAHEINNPLGGILIYSHLLLEDLPQGDQKRANLEKIVRETTRCKEIVKGLLDFARPSEPKVEAGSLNDTIESVLSLVEKQTMFQNIAIEKNFAPYLHMIAFDKSQLQQVFMNIVLNAAESMDGKGKLIIETRLLKDKFYEEARFTDTGYGIPKENLEKLFEPFFTTKKLGEGVGLGLSISYGIVKKHGGKIEVDSEVGKGSTFTIRLPVQRKNG